MHHADEFLEKIRQTESEKLDKITKFFSDVTIRTTKEISGEMKGYQLSQVVFKPDIYFMIFVLTFFFGLLVLFVREAIFFDGGYSPLKLIVALVLLLYLSSSAIHQFFLDKRMNLTIVIDKEMIMLGEKVFKWDDIYDTAILSIRTGRGRATKILVIALNDMKSFEKLDLTNYNSFYPGGFSKKLSRHIEYFKNLEKGTVTKS